MKATKNSTLKNTQDQGHVLAILSEAILIACKCSVKVHAYLYQTDMKIERGVGSSNEEVLTAKVRALSTMICGDWNNSIVTTVEAKLELRRDNPGQPWSLRHIVIIFPDLYQGKCPQVFMMNNTSEDTRLEELLNDRSKFYAEYPEGKAIDRSRDTADLLRRSRLILGEHVTPWEELPTAVIRPSLKVVAPVDKKRLSIFGFIRQMYQNK